MTAVKDKKRDVDVEAVDEVVEILSEILDAHGGGVEVSEIRDGTVSMRFTGMCTGCPVRPVTLAGLVRPALLEIEGVDKVLAEGGRMSAHAEARLAANVNGIGSPRILEAIRVRRTKGGERDRNG